MPTSLGSDADRLQAIQELERAILQKRPSLDAALAEHDSAKERDKAARLALGEIDRRIKGLETQAHMHSRAIYLNGDSLDRGTLTLGNRTLGFSGWHGKIEFPLATVTDIELGESMLGPRAGYPVLQRIWPGKPRPAQTMLFSVQNASGPEPMISVIAGLPDAHDWRKAIRSAQERLEDVVGQRAALDTQRAEAQARAAKTKAELAEAEAGVKLIQSEIGQFRTEKNRLHRLQQQANQVRQQEIQNRRTAANAKRKGGKR